MGLLDWLTSDLGGLSGGGGEQMPPGMYPGGGGTSMPPVQQTGVDVPPPPPGVDPMGNQTGMTPLPTIDPPPNPLHDGMSMPPGLGISPPMPPGGDPMAGTGSGNNGGLPMPPGGDPMAGTGSGNNGGLPPMPLPQPRPVEAAGPAALPPNAVPTGGAGMPPGLPMDRAQDIVRSYERAGGNAFAPPDKGGSQGKTILGRALGLDGNTESQLRGTLGAGFTAAGNSAGKSPGQAFSSGVGAGIEGGKKADDKTTEQQDKYLARAIAAKKEGNNAEYQKNYLRYQIEATKAKLEASKEKAAGSASVMNSPEQLYLRGVGATNADGELKILAAKAKELEKVGSPEEKKAAMDAYNARRQQVLDGHLKTLGVDPSKVKGLESKEGFSDKNPMKDFGKDPAAAQKKFDALPEGAYFINPKDGRLLVKKGAGSQPAANPAQPQQQSELLPPMPPIPSDPTPAYSEAA